MHVHLQSPQVHDPNEGDQEIVAVWTRKDKPRWIAGILAGAFAGLISLAFAMVLSRLFGFELWYPAKLAALPFLGNSATGFGSGAAIAIGILVHEILCSILGLAYAHFTGREASASLLLGAGITWGAFSWIFIENLFVQSFPAFRAAVVPSGAAFPVLMVFGIALTSVSFFDRLVRR